MGAKDQLLSLPLNAERLCTVRVLAEYARVLDVQNRLTKMHKGQFFCSPTHKLPDKVTWAPLSSERLAKIVKSVMAAASLKMSAAENSYDTATVLGAHFIRGHAGSIAYHLAMEHGARWDPLVAPDRARHTLDTFLHSYYRGVAPRLVQEFHRHPQKQWLRFESASRL